MLTLCLFFAVFFVAYSNGANDNSKGVASLFGSRTCNYRTAIGWATVTTCAGSGLVVGNGDGDGPGEMETGGGCGGFVGGEVALGGISRRGGVCGGEVILE